MNKGVDIKAYGNNIHITPTDDDERNLIITMYTRVNVTPKVIGNTYIISREDWDKILEASDKRGRIK